MRHRILPVVVAIAVALCAIKTLTPPLRAR